MTYIVTALKSEALPIIDFFNLLKNDDLKFKIFVNDKITIIISGIGKINSAIATTYLSPQPNDKIINIGICGGTNHKIGEIFQIKKIIDKSSNKVVHIKNIANLNATTITCCDLPQNDPKKFKNTLIDMESFGFYEASCKFVEKENIQLIKIVSDKISDTILTPKEVHNLIYPHLKSIF